MKKTFYLLMAMLISISVAACGSDDNDEPGGASQNQNMAWVGDAGDNTLAILTFDTENTGCMRLRYANKLRFYSFSYTSQGNTRDIFFTGGMGSGSLVIDGSTAKYYSSSGVTFLAQQPLARFYQDWYDDIVARVIDLYNKAYGYSKATSRANNMYLSFAIDFQGYLPYIRSTAQSEGITVTMSEWETKQLE